MKELSFNDRFADAVRAVSGWDDSWIVKDIANVGLFLEEPKSPDVLLILPNSPPIVVECKFHEGAGDPVDDARSKLGLTLSGETYGSFNRTAPIRRTAALYYPPGANKWGDREVVNRFVSGKEGLRWKFVSGTSADDCTVWPKEGWLKGTISDFCDSVTKTASDAETINLAAGAAAGYVLTAAASLEAELGNYPNEKERISALMGSPDNIRTGLQWRVWCGSILCSS